MNVRYMGTYNMDMESLPNKEEREGATKFREASAEKLSKIITTFSFFLLMALYISLFVNIKFNLMGLCIGAASSILILFPHEILHAVCFKEECYLYSNIKNGMIFVVGNEDMSKSRFIFMTLFPNFIFGILPYATAFLLYKYGVMSFTCYILGGFGATALVAGAGDFYNAYIALVQMPWRAKTYLHKFDSYWYYPVKNEENVEEVVTQETSEPVEEEAVVQEVSEAVEEVVVQQTSEPVEEVVVQEASEPVEEEAVVQEASEPVEEEVVVQEASEPVEEVVVQEVSEAVEEEVVQETSEPMEEENAAEQENTENKQEISNSNSDNIDDIVIKDIISKINNSQEGSSNDASIDKIPEDTREQITKLIHNALYGEAEDNKAPEVQEIKEENVAPEVLEVKEENVAPEVQEAEEEKVALEVLEAEKEDTGEETQEQEQVIEEIHEDEQEQVIEEIHEDEQAQDEDDSEDLGKILQNAIKWLNKELRYK